MNTKELKESVFRILDVENIKDMKNVLLDMEIDLHELPPLNTKAGWESLRHELLSRVCIKVNVINRGRVINQR